MADVGKYTPGPCPHCQTPMVNTGAPIWEDYCPDKACTGFFDEMKKTLRAAHAEWLARERIRDAAPDLLGALKAMDAALCDGFDTQPARMAGRKALIAARAAVAKAEGRAP